jgi:hypothetical protein
MSRKVDLPAAEEASRLWLGTFHGVLSTHSESDPGYPFGSVVPHCVDGNGRPLLLLSRLAQHTRNLASDPRCAFTIFDNDGGDIQQGLRLTCMADCRPIDDADSFETYCRHFPRGRFYAGELDFRLYRLEPLRFHFNGGFATARWLGSDRILVSMHFDAQRPDDLLAQLAGTHADWLAAQRPADCDEPTLLIAADRWGVTLRCGERLFRRTVARAMTKRADLHVAIAEDRLQ